MRKIVTIAMFTLAAVGVGAIVIHSLLGTEFTAISASLGAEPVELAFVDTSTPEARALAQAAESQVGRTVSYSAAYVQLEYPGGDVPIETGVCTDVVIRALRDCGVDLQVEVHEDMTDAFDEYPSTWGLEAPDSNIDHRRVPNLQTYFTRRGIALPVTDRGEDYLPGDIVTWNMGGKSHIGVVSTQVAADGTRFCIAHNIGRGTRIEDFLFRHEISGHYRWFG